MAHKLDMHRYMELDKTDLFLKSEMWRSLLNLNKMYFTPKNYHKKLITQRIFIYNIIYKLQLHINDFFFI